MLSRIARQKVKLVGVTRKMISSYQMVQKDIDELFNSDEISSGLLDNQKLIKTFSKYVQNREIEKANSLFDYLQQENQIVNDLSLCYLVQLNLSNPTKLYSYLVYAELTNQVLDYQIYKQSIFALEEQHVSYLVSTFKLMTNHFQVDQRLFEEIYKIAYIHCDSGFVQLLDQYRQQNDIKVDSDKLLNQKPSVKKNQSSKVNQNQFDTKLTSFMSIGDNEVDDRLVDEQEFQKIDKIVPIVIKLDKNFLSQDEIIELTEKQINRLFETQDGSEDSEQS